MHHEQADQYLRSQGYATLPRSHIGEHLLLSHTNDQYIQLVEHRPGLLASANNGLNAEECPGASFSQQDVHAAITVLLE